MSILYRDHRGGLKESMETVQSFDTKAELFTHLQQGLESIVEIGFDYCCYDDRIKWDTYYVWIRTANHPEGMIAGMSNGTFDSSQQK